MEAIILAAGRGRRLEDFNPEGLPKCLLEFGGRSLLDRQLSVLRDVGIGRVELVIGYEADQVIAHVGTLSARPEVSFIYNPHYEDGSVISLHAAGDVLAAGDPVFVMDADVLFHPEIAQCLVNTRHKNCFLLDRNFEPGDEPVKIAVRDGRMVEFRKTLGSDLQYDMLGESVGFFRFGGQAAEAIARACACYEREGLADAPHEEALRDVLLKYPDWFDFEDISGLPWMEIDFAGDIAQAHAHVLPAIRAEFPEY
jgi:choline kinase